MVDGFAESIRLRANCPKIEFKLVEIGQVGRLSDLDPTANHSAPELFDKKTFNFYCAICCGSRSASSTGLFDLLLNERWAMLPN